MAGGLPRPESLRALPEQTASWTLHGKSCTVVRMPLEQVLARAGYDKGPMTKEMAPRDKRSGYRWGPRRRTDSRRCPAPPI